MKINKKLSIERDPFNYIVVIRKKNKGARKDGKIVKPKNKYRYEKKYYPTLNRALLSIMNRDIDLSDVKSIIGSLRDTEASIEKALAKAAKEGLWG